MMPDKRPIALEDLLKLKRAERPAAEFWSEFDRQLRAKQLAALVSKRPWWQRTPSVFALLARYPIPLGASAILLVTFVSVRNSDPASASLERRPEIAEVPTPRAVSTSPEEGSQQATTLASRAVAAVDVATPRIDSAPATQPEAGAGIASWPTFPATQSAPPSAIHAQYVPGVLPATVAEPVVSGALLARARSFESRGLMQKGTVEPLQQITPPGERGRSRILTAMVSMAAHDGPSRATERHANRISEEQLYDQINRFGAHGAGVSMKF